MKLTVFDSTTLPQGTFGTRSGAPSVTFQNKGAIRLNAAAADLIGVKAGDKIAIAQDEENPADWYVFAHPEGYELRLFSDKKSLGFNNTPLKNTFYECFSIDAETKGVRLLLAGQPTKVGKDTYWGLLSPTA